MNDLTLIRSDISRFSRGTVRVGIEPTGYARWFGRLLGELVLRLSARAEAQKDFSFGTCKLLLFS
jgi:transposase